MKLDYTYEYREELQTYTYRRFYGDYPNVYTDGDSLEEANARFKAMMQDFAVAAIEKGWIKLDVTIGKRDVN